MLVPTLIWCILFYLYNFLKESNRSSLQANWIYEFIFSIVLKILTPRAHCTTPAWSGSSRVWEVRPLCRLWHILLARTTQRCPSEHLDLGCRSPGTCSPDLGTLWRKEMRMMGLVQCGWVLSLGYCGVLIFVVDSRIASAIREFLNDHTQTSSDLPIS